MPTAKVLGGITAAIILGAIVTILYFLPESGAAQLMRKAFHLGWPGGLIIVSLMLYFQFWRTNDPRRGELVFKSVIGLLGYSMLFIAIANYATNFNDESPGVPGEPRFLPVSLVMFTVACFTMAMYFKGVRVLLQIGGFMFFVAAGLAGFGNWLPQVKADPPPVEEKTADVRQMSVQERADLGEKIIFGAVGASGTQGAIGKGQCPLCHGFQKGFLSERAPNLFGVPTRALERIKDPRYSQADPSKRDTVQKEACPGCGTAKTAEEYIAESHVCPNCYVVAGFGVKGTNDKESPMPAIHKRSRMRIRSSFRKQSGPSPQVLLGQLQQGRYLVPPSRRAMSRSTRSSSRRCASRATPFLASKERSVLSGPSWWREQTRPSGSRTRIIKAMPPPRGSTLWSRS